MKSSAAQAQNQYVQNSAAGVQTHPKQSQHIIPWAKLYMW